MGAPGGVEPTDAWYCLVDWRQRHDEDDEHPNGP
jgi:hypothetical protein